MSGYRIFSFIDEETSQAVALLFFVSSSPQHSARQLRKLLGIAFCGARHVKRHYLQVSRLEGLFFVFREGFAVKCFLPFRELAAHVQLVVSLRLNHTDDFRRRYPAGDFEKAAANVQSFTPPMGIAQCNHADDRDRAQHRERKQSSTPWIMPNSRRCHSMDIGCEVDGSGCIGGLSQ